MNMLLQTRLSGCIPGDLMNEPAQVIPLTASLPDTAQAIRTTARKAVMELQDKALRLALLARPRVATSFQPGDIVAYWRAQKRVNGVLHQDGKWYGSAIVTGKSGQESCSNPPKTNLQARARGSAYGNAKRACPCSDSAG